MYHPQLTSVGSVSLVVRGTNHSGELTMSTTRLTTSTRNRSGTSGVISAGSNLAACLDDGPKDFSASVEDLKSGNTFALTV